MHSKVWDSLLRFWETDRGLSAFLFCLVVVIFLMPALSSTVQIWHYGRDIFFVLVLLAGVVVSTEHWWTMLLAALLVIGALAIRWAYLLAPSTGLAIWNEAGMLITLGMFALVILRRVFRQGPVTQHRIEGAVAAYLLFGLVWATAYKLVSLQVPDAFAGAWPRSSELDEGWVYYSFVTLTTMGYGDITPVAPLARSLAILEALTGQLYPAILLGRLVSLQLATTTKDGKE
jgi:hypothetical protein